MISLATDISRSPRLCCAPQEFSETSNLALGFLEWMLRGIFFEMGKIKTRKTMVCQHQNGTKLGFPVTKIDPSREMVNRMNT